MQLFLLSRTIHKVEKTARKRETSLCASWDVTGVSFTFLLFPLQFFQYFLVFKGEPVSLNSNWKYTHVLRDLTMNLGKEVYLQSWVLIFFLNINQRSNLFVTDNSFKYCKRLIKYWSTICFKIIILVKSTPEKTKGELKNKVKLKWVQNSCCQNTCWIIKA